MKTKTIYFFVICLTIITHPVVAQKHITKAEVQKVATNALRMLNNSNDPYDIILMTLTILVITLRIVFRLRT